MNRLTRWNGSKYILPQGRTPDGISYWRVIADRLAEYENTMLTPQAIEELKKGGDKVKLTLRQWRMVRDITIREASEEIGVSQPTIVKWEKHGAMPNTKLIPAIEKAYNIKWSDDVLMP